MSGSRGLGTNEKGKRRRNVKKILALAAAALLLGAVPAFAQVVQNAAATQTTTAIGAATATGGSATATGGSAGVIGSGNSDSTSGVSGSGNSDNSNQNQNDNKNTLKNNPTQQVISNSVPNLIQLPGLVPGYPNFTQPYKPDVFINGAGPVRPASMTYAQAKACNGQASDDSDKRKINLYYPQWDKVAPTSSFSGYVGSSRVEEKDGFWIEAVCEAAKKAMDKGASEGVIEYVIRPVNRTWGFGGSASFGGSGMPVGGANPYALAGAVGLGMGISGAYVKGELMLNITGFTSGNVKSARMQSEGAEPIQPVSFVPEQREGAAKAAALIQGQ